MSVQIDIMVTSDLWSSSQAAEATVRRAITAAEGFFDPCDAEVSVLLCDDAEIQRLNAAWRGKDKATNVLSFPSPAAQAEARHLGDIAIAYETLEREASEERKLFAHHLSHLALHGYLHLLGFDHETDDDAEEMEELERLILAELGIDDPYQSAPQERKSAR